MFLSRNPMIPMLVVFFIGVFTQQTAGAPSHQFPFGIIQGHDLTSFTSKTPVFVYYGIPYAEPPVGGLRFKPPQPYRGKDAQAVVSSEDFREVCVQVPKPSFPMSEDCLHLNIFSPAVSSQRSRKVMVWFHGGGFVVGETIGYIPTDLVADYDVIVVSVQYRLGYLGFMSSGDEASPGNYGLMDQIQALTWVKDNIAQFGGDPADVTIFGQSGGAASVSYLSLSPRSNGLFTKAIMQSGTALAPWASITKQRALDNMKKLARNLNCYPWYYLLLNSKNLHLKLVECLRNTPIDKFLNGIGDPFQWEENTDVEQQFRYEIYAVPVVDGDVIPQDPAFLLQDPVYLRQNGVSSRSYMAGITNDESGLLLSYLNNPRIFTDANFRALARFYAQVYFPFSWNKAMVDLVDFIYTYPRQDGDGRDFKQNFGDLTADVMQLLPTVKFLNLLTTATPETDTFLYLFDNFPDLVVTNHSRVAMPHGFDLLYLFDDMANFAPVAALVDRQTPNSTEVKDIFRGCLSEFAKTGNPSRGRQGKAPTLWPRFEMKTRHYMSLSPRPEAQSWIFSRRVSLWQDFLPKITN